jgi:uncharacterized protein (DUF1501 family)
MTDTSPVGSRDSGLPRPRTAEELDRFGPTREQAALRVHAEHVCAELDEQKRKWDKGFTRRRTLFGVSSAGIAALGAQLVTTRVAFADPATTNRTLVVIFLRGGMDGLSVVQPVNDSNLRAMRPGLTIAESALLPAGRGFGLNPALAPLQPYWKAGTMAAVHAVATPDASRSHFQAQDCIERGAADVAVSTGWLDRVLRAMGPGTTFRAIAEGNSLPRSLVGNEPAIVLRGVQNFTLQGGGTIRDKSIAALQALYTGLDHPLAAQAQATLSAMAAARKVGASNAAMGAQYPGGGFADGLRDIARLVKAKVGLRVAVLDLGGWDMHTNLGNIDNGAMKDNLTDLSTALAAFIRDLGPSFTDTTIVTMSEFGRRVEQNGNAGVDHGHGGLMLLLGGGLQGGQVHGKWPGLSAGALDHGDVAGANDYRDALGDLLTKRFGLGDLGPIFPGHKYKAMGVAV